MAIAFRKQFHSPWKSCRVRSRPRLRCTVRDAQQECFTLAAAAQCGRADAAAAARECQRQVQGDPGTGHSQWVAQRDRAAGHIDPRGSRPSSRALTMPTAAKASLISTRSRSVASIPLLVQAFSIAWAGCSCKGGVGSGDGCVGSDLGEPGHPSFSAFSRLVTTTAAAPSDSGRRNRR